MLAARVASIVLPPALALLSDGGLSAQQYHTRDSAGVAVTISGPGSISTAWSVEPLLSIGLQDGEEPYLFSHIWAAARLADESIAVVEGETYEIRVFDSSGAHMDTFGGRGGGPDEFGGPPWIAAESAGTLLTWDPGRYFMTRYEASGELLQQWNWKSRIRDVGITPFPNGLVWEMAGSDGDLLWTGPERMSALREGTNEHYARLILLTWEGTSFDFGTHSAGQSFVIEHDSGGYRGFGNPFAPWVASAVSSEYVAISHGSEWRVSLHAHDGRVERIIFGDVQRTPVTSAVVRRFEVDLDRVATGLGVSRRVLEEARDQFPVPDSLPAIGHLLWDREGFLWMGRRTERARMAHEYHVFNSEGRWEGWVTLPSEVSQVLEIGEDYILARVMDELEVQYVRLYGLERARS